MNVIYERLDQLCKERGTTYTAVCKELKIQPSVIGNLKSKERGVLYADTALALANYFGVTVEYLLGGEKKTATSGDGEKSAIELAVVNSSEREQALIMKLLSMPEEQKTAFLSLLQTLPAYQSAQDEKEQT